VAGYDFEKLNHYQILNVARGASLNEIKKAFRQEIATYHPDRYVRASADEKQYARARSQRLNEAFRVLRDTKLREHYDVSMTGTPAGTPRPSVAVPTGPLTPRDHQAELYEAAQRHIESGRLIQAVGVLRRLQQINPFYRDVAALLATTEATINARQMTMPHESIRRTSWLTISIILIVAILVAIVWLLSGRSEISGAKVEPTSEVANVVVDTATPIVTRTPRRTATRTPLPATPTLAQDVLLDDTFVTAEWAEATGDTWSISYSGKRYVLKAQQNGDAAWSYQPFNQNDVRISAEMQIIGGQGGVIVRYRSEEDFVAVVIEPQTQRYRIVQRQGLMFVDLSEGTHPAISTSANIGNLIDVDVVGQDLTLTINGNVVKSLTIDTMADSSRFGMIAIPVGQDAEVAFDRLTVRLPSPPADQ
jgi:hypothetical protein